MERLFLDESGDCSFSDKSVYNHFLITVISIDHSENNKLKNIIKRESSKLIDAGWNKNHEIKASKIYRDKKFGLQSINNLLKFADILKTFKIHYIVIKKDGFKSQSFKQANYSIIYNYFTGQLLSKVVFEDEIHHFELIYDQRNKETHHKKKFNEYLETRILGEALEKGIDTDLNFLAGDSNKIYGLKAVDVVSWSIFRKYEYGDTTFYDLIGDKISNECKWYC